MTPTTTAAATLVLLVVLLAGAAASYVRTRPRGRVLIVLKSGETVAGVITRRHFGRLVLEDSTLLDTNTRVDGRVFIDRHNVRWVQRP